MTSNEIKDKLLVYFKTLDGKPLDEKYNNLANELTNGNKPYFDKLLREMSEENHIAIPNPMTITHDGKVFEGYVNREKRIEKEEKDKVKRDIKTLSWAKTAAIISAITLLIPILLWLLNKMHLCTK